MLEKGIIRKLTIMVRISNGIDAIIAKKQDKVHRSGSTKASAVTMMRSGSAHSEVSKALEIPKR